MATADNILRAKALASLGFYVFPVNVSDDPENPFKKQKRPSIAMAHKKGEICHGECGKLGHGFYDATLDPGFIEDIFERYPRAEVGVWMEPSGLVAADIDVKRSPDGEILVDGFDNFDQAWLDLPETHSFDSISGAGGKQYIYTSPEGIKLGPDSNYRGILGVDRRGGGSYSVWNGPVPTSRDAFTPAPEWLLDEKTTRSADKFEGDVKDWYGSLEPGEPSLIVRAAMDRAREHFDKGGEDYSHSDLVERQFEAVRLGSEGHSGVPQLLDLIEELFHSRTGSHSRSEEEWDYEFQEALSSAIQKHGGATELRKSLPGYSLTSVPLGVPDSLISGEPGDKGTFTKLLRSLQENTDDDLLVTSVLWNSPRTRDIAREWGLEFVHERVLSARSKPEPVRENPTIPDYENVKPRSDEEKVIKNSFLTKAECKIVDEFHTFLDDYLAASKTKGFANPTYVVPAAWTTMSMAFGRKAFLPLSKSIGLNLWFCVLGYSTTGKSTEDLILKGVLDLLMADGSETYYNLGAESSPEGLQEALVRRDGKPSIVQDDEVASFFRAIRTKEHMMGLPQYQADWYEGGVKPSQKVRLAELRGKAAKTSFGIHFSGTPDKTLALMDLSGFEDGYFARYNWVWGEPNPDEDRKYRIRMTERKTENLPEAFFDVVLDIMHARHLLGDKPKPMKASDAVQDRLNDAHRAFDNYAKTSPRYDKVYMVPDRMGMETVWKCASMLALYENRTEISMRDALIAIYHVGEWLKTALRVAGEISESPYSRDLEEMEDYIREQGGSVTRAKFLNHFRGKVIRSQREIDDRVGFLLESGRILRSGSDGAIVYTING